MGKHARRKKMRIAIAAWEIGRVSSGLGVKIGGLGVIVEELPAELLKAADKQGIDLEVEILSPCFAHFPKNQLTRLDLQLPVKIIDHTFSFEVYQHRFPDGQKVIYFWDQGQLGWTTPRAVYPNDPQMGLLLYASVSQAMAGYIKQKSFDAIHLHDYHVGLIPFYLDEEKLNKLAIYFTIHNATYQGIIPLTGRGYRSIDRINLPGEKLFHKYFEFFDNLNLMKASLLKVHESGGKITTVSGDIAATWGYAAELQENQAVITARAYAQKGKPPGEVFVPNCHLDLLEKIPIVGITNGMSEGNRPENLPELKAEFLRDIQSRRGEQNPIFSHPLVQKEMLSQDHHFDRDHLSVKAALKRLLHLEAFNSEPRQGTILLTAVGRLVEQKNLGLVADIIERSLYYHGGIKFIILASAPEGDAGGKASEADFFQLAVRYPENVYFDNTFNFPLAKLIFAGGDFCLIPSRFEPCGLVDYEASLLGNIVIARATGGLTKVKHCAYHYEWLDISDPIGEAEAFFQTIKRAVDTYRYYPARHTRLMRQAMAIDAGWDTSAAQYIHMYRYGLLMKKWQEERRNLIEKFTKSLNKDSHLFKTFFAPASKEYQDSLDWELKKTLESVRLEK